MKKPYVIILVILILVVVLLFVGKSRKLEAPTIADNTKEPVVVAPSPMPVVDSNTSEIVAVKEFTVTGKNFSFSPNIITVNKGDRVKITFNNTQGYHDIKIDEYGVATKQAQSPDTEVIEFTADKTGSFQYYCSVGSHRTAGMWGTLKVE